MSAKHDDLSAEEMDRVFRECMEDEEPAIGPEEKRMREIARKEADNVIQDRADLFDSMGATEPADDSGDELDRLIEARRRKERAEERLQVAKSKKPGMIFLPNKEEKARKRKWKELVQECRKEVQKAESELQQAEDELEQSVREQAQAEVEAA